jgi:hypothetical protein
MPISALLLVVRRGRDAALSFGALGMYRLHTAGERLDVEADPIETGFRQPHLGKRADVAL